jgi:hypothetical protein
VNQLSRTMVPKRVVLRDQPRGKIDWPITYKTRASEGMNPALFVCLENERRYSRPENQLFRWIVYQIERCLAYVPVEMNSWFRSGWDQPGAYQDQRSIGEYLAVLRHQVRHINVHIALRRVELPRAIEDRHLRTARSSKNQLYNDVADVYDAFVSTVLNPTWEAWSTMVRETFPLPADVREQAWLFDSPSS